MSAVSPVVVGLPHMEQMWRRLSAGDKCLPLHACIVAGTHSAQARSMYAQQPFQPCLFRPVLCLAAQSIWLHDHATDGCPATLRGRLVACQSGPVPGRQRRHAEKVYHVGAQAHAATGSPAALHTHSQDARQCPATAAPWCCQSLCPAPQPAGVWGLLGWARAPQSDQSARAPQQPSQQHRQRRGPAAGCQQARQRDCEAARAAAGTGGSPRLAQGSGGGVGAAAAALPRHGAAEDWVLLPHR